MKANERERGVRQVVLRIQSAWTSAAMRVIACVLLATPCIAQPTTQLPLSLQSRVAPPDDAGAGTGESRVSPENLPLGAAAGVGANDRSAQRIEPVDSTSSYVRTIVALIAVLALIAMVAGVVKFATKRSGGLFAALTPTAKAPQGVLEVLARYPVSAGTQLLVLKFDRRVLLVSQSSTKGWRSGATMQTLCELSDAADVASILIKTRGDEQASLAAKFQKMLSSEDAMFDAQASQAERNPYAAKPPSRPAATPGSRLDVIAGDERSPASQTAEAIRQRLAAMQPKQASTQPLKFSKAGGVA
jgi:flagellar biogenesis protein FliO